MENTLVDTLHTLRDIQGIQGSFIVASSSGQILARDLPSVIDDASLSQVGPRICRLMDVIEAEQTTESAALRFVEHRIDVRSMGDALLCVMADAMVNQPALRMAIRLVCRKLEAHEWSSVAVEPAAAEPTLEEEPAPITSKSSAAGAKPVAYRIYRGTRYPV